MILDFLAKSNKPLGFFQSINKFTREIVRCRFGFYILFNVFRAYETLPQEPEMELPKETGEFTDAQLALCQSIYDECKERRTHIEKKSLWTFTVIAFLAPMLVSFVIFLFQGKDITIKDHLLAATPFIFSALLLFSSFISIMRVLNIRQGVGLFINAVISENTGKTKAYNKRSHAQVLLYCAIRNTASNDHIAQFVRYSHQLLVGATFFFIVGAVLIFFGVFELEPAVGLNKTLSTN